LRSLHWCWLASGAVLGGGVAAAVTMLTPTEVAAGMPLGHVVWQGMQPTCTTTDDGVFDCVLDRPPARMTDDFTGSIFPVADADSDVAGACIGQDVIGMHWVCYTGERAVEKGLVSHDVLGEHQDGPAAG
jgi:hypothetical protein